MRTQVSEDEPEDFLYDETERTFLQHLKYKKQKKIISHQANQLRGRELNTQNRDRYHQMLDVLDNRNTNFGKLDKLVGPEEPLIDDIQTNRYFTINNTGRTLHQHRVPAKLNQIYSMNKQVQSTREGSTKQLDFGYMDNFEKMKVFKLCHLGIMKPFNNKKQHLDHLLTTSYQTIASSPRQEKSISLINKKETHNNQPSKASPRLKSYSKHTAQTPKTNTIVQTPSHSIHQPKNNYIDDPYALSPESDQQRVNILGKRKLLMKKLSRLGVVNNRITKKIIEYQTTQR